MSKKARTKAPIKATKTSPVPPLHEDQIKAKEIRERLGAALEPVCFILDEATACGFVTSFNLKPGAVGGKTLIDGIMINRKL